jgi:hypothetical protein
MITFFAINIIAIAVERAVSDPVGNPFRAGEHFHLNQRKADLHLFCVITK